MLFKKILGVLTVALCNLSGSGYWFRRQVNFFNPTNLQSYGGSNSYADSIKEKIRHRRIQIEYQKDGSLRSDLTQSNMRLALQSCNKELTVDEVSYIAFSGQSLVVNRPVSITARITVGGDEAVVNLTFFMFEATAKDIADKIRKTDIAVNWQANPTVTDFQTMVSIRLAIRRVNNELSDQELNRISFFDAVLEEGQPVVVTAEITGRFTATKTLHVTMGYASAADILHKIKKKNIKVQWQKDFDASSVTTTQVVRTVLREINEDLNDSDLNYIFFQGFLQEGLPVSITGQIKVDDSIKYFNLRVTMEFASAKDIYDKIRERNFKINWQLDANVKHAETENQLRIGLQNANPALNNSDLPCITFIGHDLEGGKNNSTTAIINVGTQPTTSVDLSVFMGAESARDIVKKIKSKYIDINWQLHPKVIDPNTRFAIKAAIRRANSLLSKEDMSHFSLKGGLLMVGEPNHVEAQIRVREEVEYFDFVVRMNDEWDLIYWIVNKLGHDLTIDFQSNPDVSSHETEKNIKNALQALEPALTNDKFTFITLAGTLTAGAWRKITATVTVATLTKTTPIWIKMKKSREAEIKDKITMSQFQVFYQQDISLAANLTASNVKERMAYVNPRLTTGDLQHISLRGVLVMNQYAKVLATIRETDGYHLKTVLKQLKIKMLKPAIPSQINSKIIHPNVKTGWVLFVDLHSTKFIHKLRTAITKANPLITSQDLDFVTFKTFDSSYPFYDAWRDPRRPVELKMITGVRGLDLALKLVCHAY